MPIRCVYINRLQLPRAVVRELETCFGDAVEHTALTIREIREEHGNGDAIVVRHRRGRYYVYYLVGPPNAVLYPNIEALSQNSAPPNG